MRTLLERDVVLAELAGLGRRVAGGAGQVVLLRGPAGVGKTAVIDRFVEQWSRKVQVLRGWCDPLSVPRPLGPLIDMAAQLPADQAAGLVAVINRGEPEAIYAALLRLLGVGPPWVCVIEDLHWADGATLDLLRFLARRIGSLPVLLMVSYRDDEVGPAHPLAVALGDVATCVAVTRVEVRPLSRRAVEVLAAGSGVNAELLHQLTGGNAFFVTEVLAAGRDALGGNALPRSVSEAVWGRLGRLTPAARDTAYAVAVCGPWIDADVITVVCPGAALDECLAAGVLVADGAAVGFRHELARRATLNHIPDHQRRLLHARALAVLAEDPIKPEALGALAFHADQAGDDEEVVRHGVAGAERASALGANRQAADLYALVLRHAETASREQKVVWLEGYAFASYLSGSVEEAAASWRAAIVLRREMGDRREEGDDLRWLSLVLWPLGHVTEAAEAGRAALRLLEELGPSEELAWALVNAAVLAAHTYDPACADYAARAVALGSELGLRAVVIRARGAAALATVCRSDTGWDELEAVWRDAIATPGLAEHAGMIGASLSVFAALHYQLGRTEGYIADTITFCADHDLGMFQLLALAADGLVQLHHGDWDRAAALAEHVLTRPGLAPVHRILAVLTAALIVARRGQRPVGPLLDEALGCTEPDDFFRLGPVWAARAEAAWLAGDDDTARAEAHKGLVCATGVMADPWLVGSLRRWAHLSGGTPDLPGVVDSVTPFRFEVSGDWLGAAAEWTRLGCPYDAAIAQLSGDIEAVQVALTTFRGLGARAAAGRAQQRLAQLRGRTHSGRRADTLADPYQLTRRQRDVLALLVAGNSDANIATKLCISPRTAAHHVEAILTKLGVNNRTQAAAVYKVETAAGRRRSK
ncbi:LuxR family transcriptional regulator [Mycobacterium sp. 1245805.9]|uniref:helix-turn-helix transcriptional regulator n=1 Tax=Mycobacterium sp. 1245805.9 TaxID=1856862 RepID=UPI000B10576F|nr:LuxR family transcriptional regulator [Mycobacterium sp. 1245805.9]